SLKPNLIPDGGSYFFSEQLRHSHSNSLSRQPTWLQDNYTATSQPFLLCQEKRKYRGFTRAGGSL
ncbi:MAG: hypothetical protein ACK528_14955, partial [Alphaproteobacteria bacterium]